MTDDLKGLAWKVLGEHCADLIKERDALAHKLRVLRDDVTRAKAEAFTRAAEIVMYSQWENGAELVERFSKEAARLWAEAGEGEA